MRDIVELFVVLLIVCFLAASSLAYVHKITEGPIAKQKRLKVLRAVEAILPPFSNKPTEDTLSLSLENQEKLTFYLGKNAGQLTGVAFKVLTKEGFGGTIEMMVGISPEGSITGVEILSMVETPGLGAKISDPGFKNAFKEKSLENTNWALKKEGGDIDQITGASVSSKAVVKALKKSLEFFENNKQQLLKDIPGDISV